MTVFRVWAPDAESVDVDTVGTRHRMEVAEPAGWWERNVAEARHGSNYAYVLDGGDPLPDPRSQWQPDSVHGPSRVYDHGRFHWTDGAWQGRGLRGAVMYELHVGTFTPEGTFDAAVQRLTHLVELGVTHVEVMPVAAFNGRHGWGYDGVGLFAVHEPYGGPDGFKRFVDACHAHGLAVVLDVVYNHLGPSGNYLPQFGPYFTERHHTPWGAAVNLDDAGSDEVRRFIVDNALMWLRESHVARLRTAPVNTFSDDRTLNIPEELAVATDELPTDMARPLFLFAQSDSYDTSTVSTLAESRSCYAR